MSKNYSHEAIPFISNLHSNFPLLSFSQNQNIELIELKKLKNGISAAGYTNSSSNIYTAGGFNKKQFFNDEIYQYNIEEDIWSKIANSYIAFTWGNAEYIDNKLYLFNGITKLGYNKVMEVIDLKNNFSDIIAKNPYPTTASGSAVLNDEIYIFGGAFHYMNSKIYSNKLFKFNPSKNEWTTLSNMPERKETKGEFIDGKLFVVCGYLGNKQKSNLIQVYDPKLNSWSCFDTLPFPISAHAITTHEKDIYIIGDYDNLNLFLKYNIENKELTYFTTTKLKRRHAGAAIIDSKLYIHGGNKVEDISSTKESILSIELKGLEN